MAKPKFIYVVSNEGFEKFINVQHILFIGYQSDIGTVDEDKQFRAYIVLTTKDVFSVNLDLQDVIALINGDKK